MREKRQISHAEKLQIIYVETLSSRMESVTPHFLSAGCTQSLPPKEDQENLTLSQVFKVNIKSGKSLTDWTLNAM